ncbi:MAG: Choline-sulfatase [Verrucomicrobiota bacterium]|jgi:uncharacterized sulfatase
MPRVAPLLLLLLAPVSLLGAAAPARPNIVFAFADDWGRYASAYRDAARPTLNDVIETPHFDRLARGGVLFWDAHCSAPSCTPSRGAVLTGRHFYRNGSAAQLHHPWPKDTPDPATSLASWPNLLRAAGYRVGLTYKTHVPAPLYGGRAAIHEPAGSLGGAYDRVAKMLHDSTDLAATRAQILGEIRGNLAALIDSAGPQPFAWWCSPVLTHRNWPLGLAQKLHGLDPEKLRGRLPAFLPDTPEIRQDLADYLALCMEFDLSLGVILDELAKRGLLANTIIAVSGDHGAPGFPRGKCNLYDFGTQVPLVIHWPAGVTTPGRRIDNPVSLIDLAPTFLAAAGVAAPAGMDGQDLLPVLRDGAARGFTPLARDTVITGRELHVRDAREGDLPYPTRALRDRHFLYIRNFKPDRWPVTPPPLSAEAQSDMDRGPTRTFYAARTSEVAFATFMDLAIGKRAAEELYDLAADPDQMRNLAADPHHAATREKMSAQLLRTLRETGDPRVVGNGDAFDRPPYHRPPVTP